MLWGFFDPSRSWHPGACSEIHPAALRATMHKGRRAEHLVSRYRARHHIVAPSTSNGLAKDTAFELESRKLKLRRIELLAPQRTIGVLDSWDLQAIRRHALRAIGRSP